jgi:hypothetical protein
MVGFLSLFCESKRLGAPSKHLRVGKEVGLETFVKPTAASKQEIILPGRPTKYLERESHGTSLKDNEHEHS